MNRGIYKKNIKKCLEKYSPGYVKFLKERYKDYKYICGFTVGSTGKLLPGVLRLFDRKLDFYCDNNREKVGKKDPYGYGIDVISLDELRKYKEETVVLVPSRFYKDIYCQLKREGFPLVDRLLSGKTVIDEYLSNNDIQHIISELNTVIDVLADEESCRVLMRLIQEWTSNEYKYGQMDDICTEPQYFPKDIIRGTNEETFVDCGAYIGDGIPDFVKFTNGNFKKYYAFELSKSNYDMLKKDVLNKWGMYADKIITENKGVSGYTHQIMYAESGQGSKLNAVGNVCGEVVALDDFFLTDEKITFIKMDIEGEELNALNGAKRIIARDLPKLAICIYHKPEDLWEIPLFIRDNWGEYDIYIRHHTDLLSETVCYAVRKG